MAAASSTTRSPCSVGAAEGFRSVNTPPAAMSMKDPSAPSATEMGRVSSTSPAESISTKVSPVVVRKLALSAFSAPVT